MPHLLVCGAAGCPFLGLSRPMWKAPLALIALTGQCDRAYGRQGRQVLTPDRLAKLKPPLCVSRSRATPFVYFNAPSIHEVLGGSRGRITFPFKAEGER